MERALSQLPLPPSARQPVTWGQLHGAGEPLAIAEAVRQHDGPCLLVVSDTPAALHLELELKALLARPGQSADQGSQPFPVLLFPDRETLPYDTFSPHRDIVSQRLEALYQLPMMRRGLVIVPVSTLLGLLPPRRYIEQSSLILQQGQQLDMHAMRQRLEQRGYLATSQVFSPGEFAARGSLLDLWPMGTASPLRLDFFDDELESIRLFDAESQRTTEQSEQINLLPANEFPTDEAAIEQFRIRYRDQFGASTDADSVYQQVSRGSLPGGIEYYLPLFFDQCETLFAYLPENTLLLQSGDIHQQAEQLSADIHQRYENRRYDLLRPLHEPAQLFLAADQLMAELKRWPRVDLTSESQSGRGGRYNLALAPAPALTVDATAAEPLLELRNWLEAEQNRPLRLLLAVESAGRREALFELLAPLELQLTEFASLETFMAASERVGVVVTPLDRSCLLRDLPNKQQIVLLSESQLLGSRIAQRRRRDRKAVAGADNLVKNLAELQAGQPVVHLKHGVGLYQGLTSLETGGVTAEYLILQYAREDKLYVPVSALHQISRYTSSADSEHVNLNRLGSDKWEKARKKAAEKVRDVAAELLDIYARRAARPGQVFKLDSEDYNRFAASFPFEETYDQAEAIRQVLNDMQQPTAMDRLVCGDVGFGKTEVAMRASFMAVANNAQVAVLVPTTLLAQQHFENFRDRFADLPVRVEVMSRFKSAKQQSVVLGELAEGKVDIVIGTHKLIQPDVQFKNLGLVIIDEEHRFGVRQKEQLKKMRSEVDILTLTATPIPRTLNMAMSGMRDLSIIATPPAKRLAIKTFVRQRDPALIREAVLRELLRGGQVYFLHNQVESIEKCASELQELLPEARVAIAHGQMRERELERVMSDFYHQRFNLLVCTTIIETGIDVPSANTIIMDRADTLGLAQLHQLRGRVGRSHHQAYAWLMTPHPKQMTKDAAKRLEAISQLEELGSGFTLASHDLEIRGAGELLGEDQSGQIASVGFSLYMEMLEQAVKALQAGKEPSLGDLLSDQCEVDLRIPALLPESFIPDINTRLSLYKQIAGCDSAEALDELQVELIDRFGLLPEPAKNLLSQTALRVKAGKLGIRKLEASAKGGMIEVGAEHHIDPVHMLGLIHSKPALYSFDGPERLRFSQSTSSAQQRLALLDNILNELNCTH